jgi:serine/threonine protein kinase/tetratricopeptide (TPR) repeat protein
LATLNPDQWEVLSPYLDHALTLPEEDRLRWLESLRRENQDLADQLQLLLEEHRAAAEEGFLEKGPALPSGGSAGLKVGGYELISPIGHGGMGTVWLAERSDGRFQRRVAVKLLNEALLGFGGEERFRREGAILARLSHPNIAELFDAGITAKGQPYLVLEHVEGEPIDLYCDSHNLEVQARIRLFLEVLDAVAHAHAHLIVHRDIKPSNVLVSKEGQVKLLDFGIAKMLEGGGQEGAATLLTREAGSALTPQYAAPEQLTGDPVTAATDVYALGVLLYLLLTGQHPVGRGAHSPADLLKAITETEPQRPSDAVASSSLEGVATAVRCGVTSDKLRRQLQGDLDTIVGKSLKKVPQERYPSVDALADDLRRYLHNEPIKARPDTFVYRTAKFVRRNRTALVLTTMVLLAIVAGVVGTLLQARTARAERDFAFQQLSRAESINDLNTFLLSDAAPSGKPFTVDELLARAERIAERQQGDTPSRVALLIAIGRQYGTGDEDAKARPLLEQAYRLSRQLTEPSPRAQASCALGSALARGPDHSRAEAFIQQGLGELPEQPQFVLDRVFCLLRGSEVARGVFAGKEAIARVQEAQRLLEQSPLRSEILDLRVLMDLAESYRVADQYSDAITAFERASLRMTQLGRDDTETAGTLFNNWALTLDLSGRPLEAQGIYRRAIEISRADESEGGVSPMLLLNYGRTLREVGRIAEAAAYVERAYAEAHGAGDEMVVNQATLMRARIYRDQGDFQRAAAMLSQAQVRFTRSSPPSHILLAVLASERSLLAAAKGDLQPALQLANQAVISAQASMNARGPGIGLLGDLLRRRSEIELRLGQVDQAIADATRAVSVLKGRAQPGVFSSRVGRAELILGRALQIRGKGAEAQAAFRSAAEHLQSTLGADHPDTREARQLAGLGS